MVWEHSERQTYTCGWRGGGFGPTQCCKTVIAAFIANNGIGFDPRFLDRIFKPFQRLHAKSEFEGSGIGLSVCRRIAERHGGELTASSVQGEGSVFVATLEPSTEGSVA